MIQLSALVGQVLQIEVVNSAFVVKIINDNLDVYITTAPFDFELKNNNVVINTYLSDGRLISLEAPSIDTAVDETNYTIVISDPAFSDGYALEADWISSQIEIRMVFFNPENINMTDSAGNSIKPEEPFQEIADTLLVYAGVIDSAVYNIDTEEIGSVEITLTCASPMYNLDATRTYLLNRDFCKTINPSDTAFDQLQKSSIEVSLIWGSQ